MSDPRALLDPRWHWLRDAAWRLYRELAAGDELGPFGLTLKSAEGELVNYQIVPGQQEIVRTLITGDPEMLVSAFHENTTDLTPELEES